MCMEQFIIIFTEYADIICVTLSVMTIMITGITLHKLKKLESQLYRPRKAAETLQPKEEAVPVMEKSAPEIPAASYAKEQEKLLDAVLGEVFP